MLKISKLWKRLVSDAIDMLIVMISVAAVFSMVGKPQTFFITSWISVLLLTLWNAAWIALIKTTPAKAIFGVSVTDTKGQRLSYSQAWKSFFFQDGSTLYTEKKIHWLVKTVALTGLAFSVITGSLNGHFDFTRTEAIRNFLVQGWTKYNFNDGKFSIHMPSKPKLLEKDLPLPPNGNNSLHYTEYVSKPSSEQSYSVSYVEMPSKWSAFGVNTLLKESLKIIRKAQPGFEILHQEFKEYAGHSVLDFQGVYNNKHVQGRLLLIGDKLFKLEVNHPMDENGVCDIEAIQDGDEELPEIAPEQAKEIEQFLGSFDCKK